MLGPRSAVRRTCVAVAAAALAAAAAPAGARADPPPVITSGPAIAGAPQVGATLTASATWSADSEPTAAWTWLRCAHANGDCAPIPRATGPTYLVDARDQGTVLRVRLRVTARKRAVVALSPPTAVVGPAASLSPPPSPAPAATATPTPTAAPAPVPVPAAAAPPRPRPLLNPFPVVRIKGLLTSRGARVTLFSVRAPRRAQVVVVCHGRGCPRARYRPALGSARVRPFERRLPAGTRLAVAVTEPGFIGKYTRIVIRRQAPPRRIDRCLIPGTPGPTRCPPA